MDTGDIIAISMIGLCLLIFVILAVFFPEWVGINKQGYKIRREEAQNQVADQDSPHNKSKSQQNPNPGDTNQSKKS
jgi:hypothetical protein